MSEGISKEELEDVLEKTLGDKSWIDADTHRIHHEYVESKIASEVRSRDRWEAVKGHVYGWAAITAITGIGLAVWHMLKDLIGKSQGH